MTEEWATPRISPVALRPREASLRERLLDRESILRQLDLVLVAAVLGLLAIGSVAILSATRNKELAAGLDPNAFLKKHIITTAIGLAMACVAAVVDYRTLRAYIPLAYVASCLGILAVLSPLGSTVNGAHSWIILPAGFAVQPAEFAKVASIVGMAMIFAERKNREAPPTDRDVVSVLALCAVPMGLIMLQPDLGSTMVFVFTILGVLTAAEAPARWIAGLLLVGALGAGFVAPHVLKNYQLDRFRVVANPTVDPRGVGYNTAQARIAIGSGGVLGKGLFHGTQTQGRFIPEQQTDFVFTVVGEETGLVGGSVLILTMGVVLWRGLRIAARASDPYGRLVAAGVVSWFGFESFVNIGMTLGIMPVTGIPLPFVSYGGSAMFSALIAVGLLQNVHMRSRDL